jgi:hypothetical protein
MWYNLSESEDVTVVSIKDWDRDFVILILLLMLVKVMIYRVKIFSGLQKGGNFDGFK